MEELSTQEMELQQQISVSSEKLNNLGELALTLADKCKMEKAKKYINYAIDEFAPYFDAFSIEIEKEKIIENSDYDIMLNDLKELINKIKTEQALLEGAERELNGLANKPELSQPENEQDSSQLVDDSSDTKLAINENAVSELCINITDSKEDKDE